jgi:hypothetical protein
MPLLMISTSTLWSTSSLIETLAPPIRAAVGRSALPRADGSASNSAAVSLRVGSTTTRLRWTQLGSIAISHGLRLGRRQTSRRQP